MQIFDQRCDSPITLIRVDNVFLANHAEDLFLVNVQKQTVLFFALCKMRRRMFLTVMTRQHFAAQTSPHTLSLMFATKSCQSKKRRDKKKKKCVLFALFTAFPFRRHIQCSLHDFLQIDSVQMRAWGWKFLVDMIRIIVLSRTTQPRRNTLHSLRKRQQNTKTKNEDLSFFLICVQDCALSNAQITFAEG